ncbi:divalent cation tolerance protein CutA [Wolbachia endosymbiont of Litomosoides sigmodontis]|uniref:divalent-cation tolerance protein CutA n=1 Tax=Wolbachia endosymbiont of Litomosoides sigmodontis TaxID=80850 RepID=UPI00158A2AE3|nr:divalent-cation tolerance protein CutA [Wolbachia endosymbiont of Litomosoides sigmodontis]QKX03015.1 divalent cation tolerance protein CutA [Wolbachia endosymbiont of Litomosoides sigmodontis]
MNSLVLVYITFSSVKEAETISKELLSKKLIVCANIFPKVNSFYLWKGKINSSREVITIMKSRGDQVEKIIEKIEAMNSYDQPAIVIIPIEKVNKSFANWINSIIDVSSIGV